MTRVRLFALVGMFACAFGLGTLSLLAHWPRAPLPPLTAAEARLARTLEADVVTLASTIGERNAIRHEALQTAADWLQRDFEREGYRVERQAFMAQHTTDQNVVATLAAQTPGVAEVVVIGAHYDTVLGSAGANDNASGVVAMRAVARALQNRHVRREVRFVAFANEEYGFQTDRMGSRVYARHCRAHGDKIVAMLSLETMAYYSSAAGSQRYPIPALGWIYPDRGDFVGVVGNLGSASLAREIANGLRERSHFPAEWAALPEQVPGAAWSDHWAFWREGYPAVMVTDTAPFRYNEYHTAKDTPDKLDYTSFARVVQALTGVIEPLAGVS